MAATRRRWAAAAGVVLALLGAAPAWAAPSARAQNATAQVVGVATWSVVVVPGTSPATGPAPDAAFSTSVVNPTYLTLTNTGTVVPGTMTFTGSVGLSLLGTVESCSQPWSSAGLCGGVRRTLTSAVYTAGGTPSPPVPGESWYLKVTAVVALGATMSVVATAPAARSVNS